jgi:hypothetical protein
MPPDGLRSEWVFKGLRLVPVPQLAKGHAGAVEQTILL